MFGIDDAALGMVAAGALSSAGQVYANSQNIKFQQGANSESIALANTAHQREVRDLIAAGLNPILSASGSGASVPSLGVASQSNPGQGIADGISAASKLSSQEYKANVENIRANTDHLNVMNSALKADRAVEDINREADELLAESRLDAVKKLTGISSEGNKIIYDRSQHRKWIDLIAGGIEAEANMKDNMNWRANLSSFVPFVSPAGINSAASAYDTFKYPKRRIFK